MKKILVTGGTGFIGSLLCEELLKQEHEVLCLDNFFTGTKSNVEHLRDNSLFEVIRHDVIDPILLEIDEIYHLACPASPVHYQDDPIKTIKTNMMGTLQMLELANKTGAKLLLASTSEVYGDPQEHPQKESYWGHVNPVGIRSCYDEGKRIAETMTMDYHRRHGLDVKIIRVFNTYGPNMRLDDGRVVSNFIVQALKGLDITMYGDGTQTRSFCYVSDLVRGIILMMNQDGLIGPVNLGNPGEFSIKELANMVLTITGSSSKMVKKPLPLDDPQRRRPDISLAKKMLQWEPAIKLEEGLKKTIPYFEKAIKGQ